ncbi:MAG: MATE family efflux transporter [Spirochaetaceae bacterium]|nr:MATE family efflux transporter [Spirochaetaceae bacterium]
MSDLTEQNSSPRAENKMGYMPLGKLLLQMSLPMMISMFVQSLYNIVDSIFVAQISEHALTAVSLAFPIQNLMFSVAIGTGVGINSLLSRRLGEKNFDEVDMVANNGIFLAICGFIVFMIVGFIVPRPYFESQTDNAEIIEYGVTYMRICLIACAGVFGAITFERLLISTGKTGLSMISQLTGTAFNLIFDPILIFGLLGFPKMGIAGAALATVLGQFAAMTVSFILNVRKNKEIRLSIKGLKPEGQIIGKIYAVGIPSIIVMSIGSILVYFLNIILGSFTTTAIAVYGVYFKLQSFVFMPVFGLNNGSVPIVGYNFGARNKKRVTKTIIISSLAACSIMLVGMLIFELFPRQLLGMFNASEEMYSIGIVALRIIAIHFPIAAFCIILSSVFQALGKGIQSMSISFIRQLIVLLPAAWLLSLTGNINNIWWAFPIAEVISLLTCVILLKRVYDKEIKTMES